MVIFGGISFSPALSWCGVSTVLNLVRLANLTGLQPKARNDIWCVNGIIPAVGMLPNSMCPSPQASMTVAPMAFNKKNQVESFVNSIHPIHATAMLDKKRSLDCKYARQYVKHDVT